MSRSWYLTWSLGLLAVTILVAVLAITSVPAFGDQELHGNALMGHMMASGGLVIALPVMAWVGAVVVSRTPASPSQRLGFWSVVVLGWFAIATIFACMLPLLGTESMRLVVLWHGYAGCAMVPAIVLLWFGWWRSRRLAKR